ncbi:restriction endonuclease [Streptomyces ficellus]|uniref:Restriction endonuclease n=1 Tax=Streptomyces ficellus TaxID=1977088 RepID=A0A6I6FPC4_9ACTN|nr:restriction endonuclease [Streptomyces ficellus]QGV82212.1 restriction endonuclease [Streptomyces ficellus]
MAISARRSRTDRPNRRAGFSLRETTFGFGLVAILLCGTGVMARAAVGDSADVPAAVLAVAGTLAVALSLVRAARRRRGTVAALVEPPAPLVEPEPPVYVDYTALDADAFEQAVADLCVRDGCTDVEVVGGAGDLGADVVATAPDGRRVVVQCKAYGPDNKVGSQDVQRFGGTCFAVHDAHVAAVVTTSEFTEPAADYAAQCGILCVDRQALDAWTDGTGPAPWLQVPLQEAGC